MNFKLRATNEQGSTFSLNYLSALIAGVPKKDKTLVNRIATGINFIEVELQEWILNGGSTLTAYELWMDNGN